MLAKNFTVVRDVETESVVESAYPLHSALCTARAAVILQVMC